MTDSANVEGDKKAEVNIRGAELDAKGYLIINLSYYDQEKNPEAMKGVTAYKLKPEKLTDAAATYTRANLETLTKGKQLDETLFFIIKDGDANRRRLFELPEIDDVLNALSFFDMPKAQLQEMDEAASNHRNLRDTFGVTMSIEEIKSKVQEIPDSKEGRRIKEEIYKSLPFEGVRRETVNEHATFMVAIAGREIKLDAGQLLDQKAFRAKFYEAFGVLLPACSTDLWNLIPLYLSSMITEDSRREVESEDVLIREAVKSYIENGTEVTDARELGAYQTFMKGRGGKVLVVNPQGLKAQIKDATSKEITDNFVQRTIIPAIKDLYVDTVPYSIEQNGQAKKVRCWLLDTAKFDLSSTGSDEGDQAVIGDANA
jgi:hypothetical protein